LGILSPVNYIGKQLFHCPECKFSAKTKSGLISHVKSKHPAEKPRFRPFRDLHEKGKSWGVTTLKENFKENIPMDQLIYSMLIIIHEDLVSVLEESKRPKIIS
jgi:uncharacterized C2H2 Zn-finger protein